MKQPISKLKEFFGAFKMPTANDFGDMIDSFFHKDGKIPASQVEGWTDDSAVILEPGVMELPELGDKNKSVRVLGGSAGKTYTYQGTPLVIQANHEAIMFWDGIAYVWKIQDQAPLPVASGVDVINPVGENITKEKAVANYVKDNTPVMKASRNMFDPTNIVIDSYVSTNNGIFVNAPGWIRTGLIPLGNLDPITLSALLKNRAGLGFYNSAGEGVRYRGINTGTEQPIAGEIYIAFNLQSPTSGPYEDVQLEKGTVATPFVKFGMNVVDKNSVEGLNKNLQDVKELQVRIPEIDDQLFNLAFTKLSSTNELNPYETLHKAFLNINDGTIITGTSTTDQYSVTQIIPASSGETIEVLNSFGAAFGARNYITVDSNGDRLTGTAFASSATKIFTLPLNSLIKGVRISIVGEGYSGDPGKFFPKEMGVFRGIGNTFEYFAGGTKINIKQDVITEAKDRNSIATIEDINNIVNIVPNKEGVIEYSLLPSGVLIIKDSEGNKIEGSILNDRGFKGNNMFNFYNYSMFGASRSNGDDVAPIHASGHTIGANHGGPQYLATIPGHGLTNLDIGTEFTKDNVKYYPVRIVNENIVAFMSQNIGTIENSIFKALTAGVMIRGAETYTSAGVAGDQLYPSIKKLKIKAYSKGKEIVLGESGFSDSIEIVENYEIKNVASILQKSIDRAGTPTDPDLDGDSFIKIENVYKFVEGLSCLVYVKTRQLTSTSFADIMGTQAIPLGAGAHYYVPNSSPLNAAVDLRKPKEIAWSTSIPTTFVVNANQPDPLNPPNRVIQYLNNTGFMIGYILDRGAGKNIVEFTDRTFEIRRETGKIYPHPIEGSRVGSIANPNDVYEIGLFRAWSDLSKTRIGNRLSVFEVLIEKSLFVYIDYSGSQFDEIILNANVNGKIIEVVESKNTELKSKLYNQGFFVNATYVEGETCFIVLKI